MVSLEKAISWQRYKRSTIMKVLGKSANEPTWFQLLSHVCSFYGVGTVKAGKKVVDNRGLTLSKLCYFLNTVYSHHHVHSAYKCIFANKSTLFVVLHTIFSFCV